MTLDQFAARVMALPVMRWRKWHDTWEESDCYGLILLGLREMFGVDLGPVPRTSIADGFSRASGWVECGPEQGATCWMAWRDGAPTHCGWMLDSQRVLHCEGSDEHPGSARISRLSAVARVYGEIRFYRYAPC